MKPSKPQEFTLQCEKTDGWWNVVEFPNGHYPKGTQTKVIETTALKERDDLIKELLVALETYACPYCLFENKRKYYPECLQYQACKSLQKAREKMKGWK